MNQGKNGTFIAHLRKEKNMTQEQLAEKMGVSINAVSKWERGLSFPDVSLYKKLCQELGISIEELINGEKDNSEEAKDRAIINTIKEKETSKRKLHFVMIISIIIVIILVIISIVIYKNSEDKLSEYYEKNYEKTFVARDAEAFLKYRYKGKYPDYYGGMYISDDADNLIVLIVKDKIPSEGSKDFYYYNELFTIDESVKIEYVKNSYDELEKVYNKINDYLINHEPPKDFNSVGIDIKKNKVIVNYVVVDEKVKKEFKEKIIKPLIELYNGKLKYQPLGADIENKYKIGMFEYYDIFFSEDYIYGDGIEIAEVRTEREEIDELGVKRKYIIFQGLFSCFETSKFVSRDIEIVFDEGLDTRISSSKIAMDSAEFEKYFDVYGAEKIEIMQILTADVMEAIIKVKKKCKCKFSIKFVGNKILFRAYTGNIFESEKLGEEFNIDHLKYYYDIIDSILNLSKYLISSINQCEI